ncbi:hypothetical protein C8R44DRAFT_864658 [Mycena epipterygia]|nr:hypothetical protein C8R44DRAFT_864658 [Mycena epipterygia]
MFILLTPTAVAVPRSSMASKALVFLQHLHEFLKLETHRETPRGLANSGQHDCVCRSLHLAVPAFQMSSTRDSSPASTRRSSPEPAPPEGQSDWAPQPKRRIVDFDVDDGDAEWEDEDQQLQGLGTTSHRSRNPGAKVIPLRKHHQNNKGPNARATATKRRGATKSKMHALAADLGVLETERDAMAEVLAQKHGMKIKEVRRRMLSSSTFKTSRRVSLYNAKISRVMATLNADRVTGDRLKIPEVKKMVKEDPSMLMDFTLEEEEEMIAELQEKRALKRRGTRATNLAAGADARRTIERLMEEITSLAERAGMIGFAMFTRGHIHDTTIPATIESWGALDFFREVLKKEAADVRAMFELWAVAREHGSTGADTLLDMQKECTNLITSGLCLILKKTRVAMNYENYIPALVEGKNVGLVNWPQDTIFKRMSRQSAIGPLRTLRDALRSGTCKWKVLSMKEKAQLIKQYDEMVESGEITKKVRKERAKKSAAKPAPRKSSRLVKAGARAQESDEEESEGDSEEEGCKAAPTKTCHLVKGRVSREDESDEAGRGGGATNNSEMRQKLLALVKKARKKAPSDHAPRSTKRKASDAADDEGCAAKRMKAADGETAPKRKRKRTTEAGEELAEDARRAKKAKSSEKPSKPAAKPAAKNGSLKRTQTAKSTKAASAAAATPTIPRLERPKPRPIVKPVAATLPADNGPSTHPRNRFQKAPCLRWERPCHTRHEASSKGNVEALLASVSRRSSLRSEGQWALSAREHLVGDRLMDVGPYARCPASFLQIFALLDPTRHNLHQPIHCPFAFLASSLARYSTRKLLLARCALPRWHLV